MRSVADHRGPYVPASELELDSDARRHVNPRREESSRQLVEGTFALMCSWKEEETCHAF